MKKIDNFNKKFMAMLLSLLALFFFIEIAGRGLSATACLGFIYVYTALHAWAFDKRFFINEHQLKKIDAIMFLGCVVFFGTLFDGFW